MSMHVEYEYLYLIICVLISQIIIFCRMYSALDRDAGKAAAVAVGGAQPQEHMFPQVQTKYTQQRQPNKGEQKGGSGGGAPLSMEVIMQRLDYFARYMQSNDGRMRELESNIVMLESQGDYQVSSSCHIS